MWTSKLLRSCTASPGRQTAAACHTKNRDEPLRVRRSLPYDMIQSRVGLFFRVPLLGVAWTVDTLTVCDYVWSKFLGRVAWLQQSSFCYGRDAQAIQKVTCNIRRHDTEKSFELAQLLGVSWSMYETLIINAVVVSQNSVCRSSVFNQVWRTVIEQGLWKLLAWFYLNMYFELSMVAYIYMHW